MEKRTFSVSGMKCMHCKANVENAICGLEGVAGAEANLETRSVTVEYDAAAVTPADIKKAVDGSGRFELTF
ncbi:MAG: heavy-metal-associated domain-containing protein [Bacteroidaceae bacterium]|nr:heavy-metal-associated domain-containing protein [Bacteroidaceae bacterium]